MTQKFDEIKLQYVLIENLAKLSKNLLRRFILASINFTPVELFFKNYQYLKRRRSE
jgi:hypothetical protein